MKVSRKHGEIFQISLSEKEVEKLLYRAIEQEFEEDIPALKRSTVSMGVTLFLDEPIPIITNEEVEI